MRGSRLHCSPYIVPMQLLRWYTAYNTVISANFLMRKFYGNSSEAVRFHKIFRPVNYVKCPHFTQWYLISFFSSHSYCKDGIPQFFSSDPRGCNNGDVFLFYRGEKKFLWHRLYKSTKSIRSYKDDIISDCGIHQKFRSSSFATSLLNLANVTFIITEYCQSYVILQFRITSAWKYPHVNQLSGFYVSGFGRDSPQLYGVMPVF